MKEDHNHKVCPIEKAGKLDNWKRWIIHHPGRLLGRYVKKGMTVLDFGCGPGLFSRGMARKVGDEGKVIAADLQEEMLELLKGKIKGKRFEKRIKTHKCNAKKIGIDEKVNFILAFYVVHEVPSQENFFKEAKMILEKGGKVFIAEPKFRVSKEEFEDTLDIAKKVGFKIEKRPWIYMSRAAVIRKD
jgi:ubiquinone/menaquinone biosynthesis C-methylase UbiE